MEIDAPRRDAHGYILYSAWCSSGRGWARAADVL